MKWPAFCAGGHQPRGAAQYVADSLESARPPTGSSPSSPPTRSTTKSRANSISCEANSVRGDTFDPSVGPIKAKGVCNHALFGPSTQNILIQKAWSRSGARHCWPRKFWQGGHGVTGITRNYYSVFRQCGNPAAALASYLAVVHKESVRRVIAPVNPFLCQNIIRCFGWIEGEVRDWEKRA